MTPAIKTIYNELLKIQDSPNEKVAFIRENHAFVELLAEMYSGTFDEAKNNAALPSLPDEDNMRAMEVTVFNNGKNAYGASIQAWEPSDQRFSKGGDWKGNARLWSGPKWRKELGITITRSKETFNSAKIESLFEQAITMGYTHVGLICSKTRNGGTKYYRDHIICTMIVDDVIQAMLIIHDSQQLHLEGFVNTNSDGNAFARTSKGNIIISQTRTSWDPQLASWSSHLIEGHGE